MATAHAEPNYMGVFWWLFALTIGEIGVIYLGLPRLLLGILLVGFAVSKAALVAMYFMHLKFERRTLALIAVTPLLLCVLLVFALLPDHSAVPHQSAASPPPPATSQQ
ncbi:MAG: cytochrome C oxidase subunit IV family protein [Candidatus Methylomirabilales bacterium]